MEKVWQAKLEIDRNALIHNIQTIKEYVGPNTDIMPIIKDTGYKTNFNSKIDILNECNIKIVGVAIVDEAVELRQWGYDKEIFILNQIYEQDIALAAEYNITLGIGSVDFLKELGKYVNDTFKIHIEMDTGMGRTGIKLEELKEFINEARKYNNIQIEGIYTHFSCSDCDIEFTKKQISLFDKAVNIAKEENVDLKYIHCCNSAGIIDFPEAHYNLVRPGIILYGYFPDESLKGKIDLKPVIKLKSKISFLKEVEKGTTISYGKRFITGRKSKIATVQLGYADGIRRCLTNRGKVVINGHIAPIVGTVCMDCFMVDVTDIPNVKLEDDVYIWDNKLVTVEDIANIYGTINYEVISTISERVVREYV